MSWRYYSIFISHAWAYDGCHFGIVRLSHSHPCHYWRNYSASREGPFVDPGTPVGKQILTERLREQIRQASCFMISASKYIYHLERVLMELGIAREYGKPIVGVRSWGQLHVPRELDDAYDVMGWRAEAVVRAIRGACR